MTTSQQEADELLREWQERRRRGADELLRQWQEWRRRGIAKRQKINDVEGTIQRIEAGFALFVLKEMRARTGVHSAAPQPKSDPQAPLFVGTHAKPLPRYAERDRNGRIWFRVDKGCKRVRLPNDPTTAEFHGAYCEALVDAAARETDDGSDCVELERWHDQQRKELAK